MSYWVGGALPPSLLGLVRPQGHVDGSRYKGGVLVQGGQTIHTSISGQPHAHAMAMVVPCASCYASSSLHPMGFFRRGSEGYMSLLSYHGPRWTPRPRLASQDSNMTLRQICHMLRVMREIRDREAAAAARKQGASSATPGSPTIKSEKRCLPACFRRRRSNNLKRVS